MKKDIVEKKRDRHNSLFRALIMIILIALQIVWIYAQLESLRARYPWIAEVQSALVFIIVLIIYGRHMNSAMKLPWIILILVAPVFGVFMYLLVGLNGATGRMRDRYQRIDLELMPYIFSDDKVLHDMEEKEGRSAANQSRYIRDYADYPVYNNSSIRYFPSASEGLRSQLADLAGAESFIFMDYHAIEDSVSFRPIHEILKERAAAGVEVRLFYDYVGSMPFINSGFRKKMEADGIKCRVFNPIVPFINLFLNNRDHRKITVIDGKIGYTGGYNLADEYFNVTHPYGHWLDTGVRIEGEAVKNLTVAFLENWNAIRSDDLDDIDYRPYLPDVSRPADADGFIQPYADIPVDEEHVGQNVYMNVLNQAEKYVWFITPYLIITDEMTQAFRLAAKRGVDVRIITPGIPDKKLIYQVTRSYYAQLVRGGVRIYEYTPGFCHAKMCVSDDHVATCGTINLDYRSLYHHFENGCFFCGNQAVLDIRDHFEQIFPECREVTAQYRQDRMLLVKRVINCILRLFAPLL